MAILTQEPLFGAAPAILGRMRDIGSASVPKTGCDANSDLSSEDALRLGRTALMFNLQRDAFDCLLLRR